MRARQMYARVGVEAVRRAAIWFEPGPDGFGALLERIGDATLVLIGEASHGTHEFYQTRAELTKALILHKGFNPMMLPFALVKCAERNQECSKHHGLDQC